MASEATHLVTSHDDTVNTIVDLLDSVLELVNILGDGNLDLHPRDLAERIEKLFRNGEVLVLSTERFHGVDLGICRNNLRTRVQVSP